MSQIRFMQLPSIPHHQRLYLIKIKSKHCSNTTILDIPYGTNGEEWLRIKEYTKVRLSFALDQEPHTYIMCDIQAIDDGVINFETMEFEAINE
jgi:hypothetical protein